MEAGEVEELETTLDGNLALLPIVGIHAVPLVNCNYQGTTGFFDKAGQMGILICYILLGIKHQDHHVCRFNRLQRFDDREFFNSFKHATLTTYACRIDQLILLVATFELDFDGITRSPRLVKCNNPLFAQ